MSTPLAIMTNVAALMNDQDGAVYTPTVQLPYFNMALLELQETFEQNNIASTNVTSAIINVLAGIDTVAFFVSDGINPPDPDVPYLPSDLIEIRQLWESPEGLNQWTPMTKKEFLPHYLEDDAEINQFLIWAWWNQEIKLIAANQDIDLKLDYIRSLFTPITIDTIGDNLIILNIDSYLQYKVAALCSFYIGENPDRASVLESQAEMAMNRSLGISIKSAQWINTRRRPYRQSWKTRTIY